MALTTAQIQALVTEARAAGLSDDEVRALEWVLVDRAADLSGAERLDMALFMADERDTRAADAFVQEMAQLRGEAIRRGVEEMNAMSDEEWEGLINGDL